jgi:hypothetical protein
MHFRYSPKSRRKSNALASDTLCHKPTNAVQQSEATPPLLGPRSRRAKLHAPIPVVTCPVLAGLVATPSFGASTILGSRIVKVDPRPG